MAKLQREDAKMLWDEMGNEKSWRALHAVLARRQEKSKGMEDCTVIALLDELKDRQGKLGDFPGSPDKLADILNKDLDRYLKTAGCSETARAEQPEDRETSRRPQPVPLHPRPEVPSEERAQNDWREEESQVPGEEPHSGAAAAQQPDEDQT